MTSNTRYCILHTRTINCTSSSVLLMNTILESVALHRAYDYWDLVFEDPRVIGDLITLNSR